MKHDKNIIAHSRKICTFLPLVILKKIADTKNTGKTRIRSSSVFSSGAFGVKNSSIPSNIQ
jgi:hypothetical protein